MLGSLGHIRSDWRRVKDSILNTSTFAMKSREKWDDEKKIHNDCYIIMKAFSKSFILWGCWHRSNQINENQSFREADKADIVTVDLFIL